MYARFVRVSTWVLLVLGDSVREKQRIASRHLDPLTVSNAAMKFDHCLARLISVIRRSNAEKCKDDATLECWMLQTFVSIRAPCSFFNFNERYFLFRYSRDGIYVRTNSILDWEWVIRMQFTIVLRSYYYIIRLRERSEILNVYMDIIWSFCAICNKSFNILCAVKYGISRTTNSLEAKKFTIETIFYLVNSLRAFKCFLFT